ncbi:MAG: hypothetical protein JWN74_2122 [Acidobacteriaceae bacterium]|jgi:hypothetical protein|nr:hypothetical protein [Acidobacteriaceae bacterium]
MPKAKSPRTPKPKAEKKVLQMPENGNSHNGSSPLDLEGEIRLRAYQLYVERGSLAGFEEEDWLSAEREVLARYAGHSHTA